MMLMSIVFLLLDISALGQGKVFVTERKGFFKIVSAVNVQDSTVRMGPSTTYYKGKIIEQGPYRNNERVGRWRFFNLESILDYEYDFDTRKLVYVSGIDRAMLKQQTPCLYKGSPLIPYLFLVNQLAYPQRAISEAVEGRVVLALKVSRHGRVTGFYLAERLHPLIDKAVVEVAKIMPPDWQFIAATQRGQAVEGEYHITIEFALD